MPRSATDATRFTSTTPHASTKLPTSTTTPSNSIPQRKPGPAGETPQEKVRRLRAAANAAREAQVTGWDKVIIRGRVWADRAHRFTALSLIGLTFICGGVTVYALGDMMIHNRSKRAQYFAEQKARHQSAVYTAKLAIQNGTASEDEIEFIEREEEEEARVKDFLAKKAQKKGVFKTVKGWMFSGLKKEEGEPVSSGETLVGAGKEKMVIEHNSEVVKAIEDKKAALQSTAKKAFEEEKTRQVTGGPLDRIGTSADEPPKSGGGWTSFMTRK